MALGDTVSFISWAESKPESLKVGIVFYFAKALILDNMKNRDVHCQKRILELHMLFTPPHLQKDAKPLHLTLRCNMELQIIHNIFDCNALSGAQSWADPAMPDHQEIISTNDFKVHRRFSDSSLITRDDNKHHPTCTWINGGFLSIV